jgi:hypothetical protein
LTGRRATHRREKILQDGRGITRADRQPRRRTDRRWRRGGVGAGARTASGRHRLRFREPWLLIGPFSIPVLRRSCARRQDGTASGTESAPLCATPRYSAVLLAWQDVALEPAPSRQREMHSGYVVIPSPMTSELLELSEGPVADPSRSRGAEQLPSHSESRSVLP